MSTEERLRETWYGERRPGFLLSTLERVYASVSAARRARVQPAADLAGRPIVVVGNITVGGTGKTPLVIRLCELLKDAGITAGVVSRGYGRDGSGPVTVTADTPATLAGDEPLLIARRCRIPVEVDADREAAARRAFDAGAEVVLSDDGLQRASLPRSMELCVVDAARGFGNGRLLPAGPLREPLERLASVDAIVCNGDPSLLALPESLSDRVVAMTLEPTGLRRLGSDETVPVDAIADTLGDQRLTAIAGMGHPERFFSTLERLGLADFSRRAFPDHHDYTASDFEDIDGTPLMTEKDAVKVEALGLARPAWVLQVGARLPLDWEVKWLEQLRRNIE